MLIREEVAREQWKILELKMEDDMTFAIYSLY